MDKYRAFTGILYPDSTSYDCNEKLELLQGVFDQWGYIVHDTDVNEDGTLKKPHYHWVGYRKNAVTMFTIVRQMGLDYHEVEWAKKGWRSVVRYLTHIDYPEKAQYATEDITANFRYDKFMKKELDSEEMAAHIYRFIMDGRVYHTSTLIHWCIDCGYWSELRRSFSLWAALMRENAPVAKDEEGTE